MKIFPSWWKGKCLPLGTISLGTGSISSFKQQSNVHNIVFRHKRFFANTRNPSQRICICHWTNPCVQKSLFINLLYDCTTYLGNSKKKKNPTNCKWEVTWFKEFILQTSLFNEVIKICFYQSMYTEFIRCQHEPWTYESWYFHETEYFLLPDNIFGLRQSYLSQDIL